MNRNTAIALAIVAALAVSGWWWTRPAPPARDEAEIVTEVSVQTGRLATKTLRRYVVAYGVVEPEFGRGEAPGAGARLSPAVAGVVAEIACEEGGRAASGDLLLRLDTRQADAQVRRARDRLAFARQQHERQKKLLLVDGTSQKLLAETEMELATASDELAAAEADLALLEVRAPFAGVVASIEVRPGEAVSPGAVVVELVDPDRLIVTARVPTADLDGIVAGRPTEILVTGQPPTTGSVVFVSPSVDTATGTALVRSSVPRGSHLRAGQYVKLSIVSEERSNRLAAPAAGVVRSEDGSAVIALVRGDRAFRKPVTAGLREGDWIEVEGVGLRAGDEVVTVGAYGLPEETRIRVAAH